ncbi:MAG: CHRD domain-containing protein [Geodermatophilaceae bacterium]
MSLGALSPALTAEPQSAAARQPSSDGASICVAALRPSSSGDSTASGSATLRIAPDEKSAVLSFQRSNLSSPETAIHIDRAGAVRDRADARAILFDVAAAKPESNGSYIWIFSPDESNSVEEIVAAIKAGRMCLTIETETHPEGRSAASFGSPARRRQRLRQRRRQRFQPALLLPRRRHACSPQSTFGATEELIAQVQQVGIDGFLREQMMVPGSSHLKFVDSSDTQPQTMRETHDCMVDSRGLRAGSAAATCRFCAQRRSSSSRRTDCGARQAAVRDRELHAMCSRTMRSRITGSSSRT